MKVFIAGSCVTRDAFTPDTKKYFEIVDYYARYSLTRLNYPAIQLDITEELFEKKVPSPFQRKLLKNDFNNNLLDKLSGTDFDYLIIDCIDERFGLVRYKHSSYVTNSDELRKAELINAKAALKIPFNKEEFLHFWRYGLKKIIDVVGVNKIIINDVLWTNRLNNGGTVSTIENVETCNEIVSQLYKIAKEEGVPETNFVNYPHDIFIADISHRWGASPFHYTQEVYDYFINYMKNLKVSKTPD